MRILLTVIHLIVMFFWPGMVGAQETPYFESFEVSLWPEYDQAAVLVILTIRLEENTPLPTTVDVTIPARVGDPFVVAKHDPVSGPDDRDIVWTRQQQGEWATISIETDVVGVYLEYYDALTFDGERRSYSYRLPGGIEIGAFRFEVQEPTAATDMLVSPEAQVGEHPSGFVYHHASLGPQSPTTPITIDFSYNNPSGQLSAASIVRPEATQGGTPELGEWIPYIIGGFGVVLLIFVVLLYYRVRREKRVRPPRRRYRGAGTKRDPSKAQKGEVDPLFCHSCGTKAHSSDNFCRSCGTKLRT